jgi:hypothetical protein
MSLASVSHVRIAMPSRYLGQLCKHFGHKVPTTLDGDRGSITFPFGTCTLEAADDVLTMRAEAPDETDLARLEQVIGSHLERFTFRDKPEIAWARQAA